MSNVDPKNWFDQSIDKAIAARDKWWVEKINKTFDNVMSCSYGTLDCPNCIDEFKKECPFDRWQQLKREVGQ